MLKLQKCQLNLAKIIMHFVGKLSLANGKVGIIQIGEW